MARHAQRAVTPGWRVLRSHFGSATVLTVLFQSFAGYAVVACGITWMPVYFRLGLGLPPARAGWLFGLQVLLQVPVGFALATLSHALLRRNVSTRIARGGLSVAAAHKGGPRGALTSACPIRPKDYLGRVPGNSQCNPFRQRADTDNRRGDMHAFEAD
ncbi:hypothetical protein AB3X93_22185 [Paraburkholderia sp. BR14262]